MTSPQLFLEIYENSSETGLSGLSDHTSEYYELNFLQEGTADYYVESAIYTLHPGDLLLTKKAENHLVKAQDAPFKILTVRFSEKAFWGNHRKDLQHFLDSRPLGQCNLFPAAQFQDTQWKYYLQKIDAHRESPDLMGMYLSVLLTELMLASPTISQPSNPRSDQMTSVIGYINNHLSENISVESICQRFFISRSQLNRMFRKMTGTSVWDYVVAKRLMTAKVLLEAGENPAAVCQKCGFNDYSPFYRAYKARYGVSPRLHKQKHS